MIRSVVTAAALLLSAGSAASAMPVTYDFDGPTTAVVSSPSLVLGNLTVTAQSNVAGALVSQRLGGLGVNSAGNDQAGRLDVGPATFESLTFLFTQAVLLSEIRLNALGASERFAWSVNGGGFVTGAGSILSPGLNNVTSLIIRTVAPTSGQAGYGFRVNQITVSPVPLPAAGAGLALGLAGLAALRRRRS